MANYLFTINNGYLGRVDIQNGAYESISENWTNVQAMAVCQNYLFIVANGFFSRINTNDLSQHNFNGDWSGASHLASSGGKLFMMFNGWLNEVNIESGECKLLVDGQWGGFQGIV